ncbi:hypothetical protein NPIL_208211 [Nephila pilipes]|uniref:Uncharacterized protein n=1 Tax=Nephila pilipes TaxID=299642 RepID=A0A8X6TI00_NEPPI|nr:hypothetical protein NPIL_208211 [Nephila pilipes]
MEERAESRYKPNKKNVHFGRLEVITAIRFLLKPLGVKAMQQMLVGAGKYKNLDEEILNAKMEMRIRKICIDENPLRTKLTQVNRDESSEHVHNLPHPQSITTKNSLSPKPQRRVLKNEAVGSKVTHWEGNPITFDTDHHLVISTLRRPRSIACDKWRLAAHQGYLVAVSAPKGLRTKERSFLLLFC